MLIRDIAILCFTFGAATSDFQQLQVNADAQIHITDQLFQGYDLASNCDLVWTMSGLLGTQFHVVRSVEVADTSSGLI